VELGVTDGADRRRQALRWLHYYWADSKELLADQEKFGESDDLFWTNHARLNLVAFGCREEQAASLAPELRRRMSEEYQPEDWIPPEVYEILGALQTGGFRLGVLSNRTEPYLEILADSGLLGYFDLVLAAGEDGVFPDASCPVIHSLKGLESVLQVGVPSGEWVR
jgi:FMN phosphatase YigB (HAD superfamily)